MLYAERKRNALLALQGMDTAGKHGTGKDQFVLDHPKGLEPRVSISGRIRT